MSKVLLIEASPRGQRSRSIAVARSFCQAYRKNHPETETETINLFEMDLPAFDGGALEAKYEILGGDSPSPKHQQDWSRVEAIIEQFASADLYILAVPMWNFSIPYRLKQYIDVLVQPGYTFRYDPETGYQGLLEDKSAFVAYARGGDYSEEAAETVDHQKSYLELILGFVGIAYIQSLIVQPTLMGGPEMAQQKLDLAIKEAQAMGAEF